MLAALFTTHSMKLLWQTHSASWKFPKCKKKCGMQTTPESGRI